VPNASETGLNTGAFYFGGGIDVQTPMRILFPIALRAEVRDFYSPVPNLNANLRNGRQHNTIFSGGLVIGF
jgi:hypothetical protein